MAKQIAVYTTEAEAFVDFIRFYKSLEKKVGTGIVAKLTPSSWMTTTIEFPVSQRCFDTITPQVVMKAMKSVPDGHVMCRNLKIELYECPDDVHPDGPSYTVDWIRNNTQLISSKELSD